MIEDADTRDRLIFWGVAIFCTAWSGLALYGAWELFT